MENIIGNIQNNVNQFINNTNMGQAVTNNIKKYSEQLKKKLQLTNTYNTKENFNNLNKYRINIISLLSLLVILCLVFILIN
jgi:CHASE3 domain sensor protein